MREIESGKLYHVVLFVTRRKDNVGLVGHKVRHPKQVRVAVTDDINHLDCASIIASTLDACGDAFERFANAPEALPGEISRMYVSLNAADNGKVMRGLQHALIDGEVNLANIDTKLASLAASPDCSCTRRWLFDADCDADETERLADEIRAEIRKFGRDVSGHVEVVPTMHNASVVTDCSFDVRDVLASHPNVEFKRCDAQLFVSAMRKA